MGNYDFSVEEKIMPGDSSGKHGYNVSRRTIVLAFIVVILLMIVVGVMAAFLGPGRARGHEGEKQRSKRTDYTTAEPGKKTTIMPATTVGPTTPGTEPYWNVRLPSSIVPVHYDVTLDVFLNTLSFTGKTRVAFKVTQPTPYVVLHVKNMNISKVELKDSSNIISVSEHFEFKKNEFYVLKLDKALPVGEYSVYFEHASMLATDLKGFYKSTYKRKDGTQVTIAATQFQPTDARRAFPCFDEPAMKATFSLTIVHDANMIAVSNMPVENTSTKDGRMTDQFQKTAIMPTYLIAFVVCDFAKKDTKAGNVSMTYYAPPDQVNQLDYSMKVGAQILPFFEKYYNVTYPLPKADMIAIPDFSAGAMENWGLITYRETALLYEDGESSESNRQRIAIVVSHELAHQWFGNLVTTKWWSDLWLNEGFASFVEYLGVDDSEPTWMIKDQFVVGDFTSALYADSLVTSHPIYVPVSHPNEINEIFDSISYSKGGSVLRMLDNFLTEKVFVKGLKSYLERYKFGNAETKDLWQSLSEAAVNIDVGKIMDTWTKQMGYPVISVTTKGDGSVQLDQKRFLLDPTANTSNSKYKSEYGYKWIVPFSYQVISKTSGMASTTKMEWLNFTSATLPAGTTGKDSFVKGNIGHYGFYRVNYDSEGWKAITEQMKMNHSVFDPKDRAGLLGDVFALARSGILKYDVALSLFDYIGNETEYVPWSAGTSAIGYIGSVLKKTSPASSLYKSFMLKKIGKKYKEVLSKPASKDHLETYLRSTLESTACQVGHEQCIKNAKDRFDKWLNNETEKIPPDSRSLSYFYGILSSGEHVWDKVFKRYQASTVGSERIKLLYGLSAIQEPWMILRYLDYSLDDSKVKSQDSSYIFSYISNANPIGRHYAWSYVKQNWKTISEKFGGGFFAMRRIIDSVTSGFSTEYELKDFDNFIMTIENRGTADRAITQAREKIKANIRWLTANEKDVEDWLRNHV